MVDSVQIRVPALGESVVEATVAKWVKQPGDKVAVGETLVELETDKVNQSIEAEAAGVLGAILRAEGETVGIGETLGTIAVGDSAPAPTPAPAAPTPVVTPVMAFTPVAAAHVTPVAQRIAQDNHIDLATVRGTGPGGRIVKEDVADRVEQQAAAPATANEKMMEKAASAPTTAPVTRPAPASAPTPWVANGRRETREKMSRRRQVIASRLVEAQHTAAMLTTFNEADLTAIMEIRKRRKDSFKEKNGVGLGFMSFFTKAAIGALKAFPYLNAEIQGDEILVKHYYDIGIAVGVPEGLVVPVVRDADSLTFAGIEKAIGDLATRARENKLALAELQGGTFTITNGGVFGSLMSTPILNAPQVGILGMHKIQERVMVVDGQMVIRPMMYLALSYDHRIVDGGDAVRFLVRIKELVEDPESLLLEG